MPNVCAGISTLWESSGLKLPLFLERALVWIYKKRQLSRGEKKRKKYSGEKNTIKWIWSDRSVSTNRNGNGPTVCIFSSSRFSKRAAIAGPKHAIEVGTRCYLSHRAKKPHCTHTISNLVILEYPKNPWHHSARCFLGFCTARCLHLKKVSSIQYVNKTSLPIPLLLLHHSWCTHKHINNFKTYRIPEAIQCYKNNAKKLQAIWRYVLTTKAIHSFSLQLVLARPSFLRHPSQQEKNLRRAATEASYSSFVRDSTMTLCTLAWPTAEAPRC